MMNTPLTRNSTISLGLAIRLASYLILAVVALLQAKAYVQTTYVSKNDFNVSIEAMNERFDALAQSILGADYDKYKKLINP